jgi:hypothetical protein
MILRTHHRATLFITLTAAAILAMAFAVRHFVTGESYPHIVTLWDIGGR